ncbi:MAG: hypothetical protein AVDCRST_MAG88-2674 [uncultured Thermomicrobiales bacterium]|uniref:Uncharacterized protein n=1 Tax=uncultured Thermomicrobiales bacterium TaxID=1645740 RepID=A0A6J4VD90_9BACT|nr:MAG: hypothetical protein AVDCRST_MAG88-2674 [uncultured Thermomicrobiales bacterium]
MWHAKAHAGHLPNDPVIMSLADRCRQPYACTTDVLVDIGAVVERRFAMIAQRRSQGYDWLPDNAGDRARDEPRWAAARPASGKGSSRFTARRAARESAPPRRSRPGRTARPAPTRSAGGSSAGGGRAPRFVGPGEE